MQSKARLRRGKTLAFCSLLLAVAAVASMRPERIVYVSCDCATLARDAARFQALGYNAQTATAVDMFPRTAHVETVMLLQRDVLS